jgi:hypothetical protein|tara:strand:- start:263 stop:1021 length:759 start_codon:yes stop_codon:yes gene_type:complete
MFDLSVSEAKRLGFALQAHALTMSGDVTRPVLCSIVLEFTETGYTLTSTDSHILLHTSHGLETPAAMTAIGEAVLLSSNSAKPSTVFRDVGKALAAAALADGDVSFRFQERDGDAGEYGALTKCGLLAISGGGVYVPPIRLGDPATFPQWRTLWPDLSNVDADTSRAVNLLPRLVGVLSKVHNLAQKAAALDGNSSVMVLEPGLKETGPIPFYFSQEVAGWHWHGIVMPTKIQAGLINGYRHHLTPEAVRNV